MGMKAVIYCGMFVCLLGPACGQSSTIGSWTEASAEAWWTGRESLEEIRRGADELQAAMLKTQERYGVARTLTNEHFLKWAAHLRWLRALSDTAFFADGENLAAFRRLGHPAAGVEQALAGVLCSQDDVPKVAEGLCRIFKAHPKAFLEYRNLALAVALVFDQPFPESWPHPYVDMEKIPSGDLDPAERFAFIVASHKAKKLLLDPRQLSVRELMFVVDSIVELRELAYAQQVDLGSTARLAQLYPVVPYDQGRISREKYMWQRGAYRLIDIGKKGGICVDQAYFVAHTGKSQGVPTILFLGQGRSGGHAWVGYLKEKGKWVLDVARYEGEDFPVGLAFDPQTWTRLTDAQLKFQFEAESRGGGFERGRMILQWALLNPNAAFYREVISEARKAMPSCFDVWELEGAWVRENEKDFRKQASFWNAWISNFDRESDMKSRGQRLLLRTMRESGDESGADRLRTKMVAENRSKRFDLGIALAADEIFEMMDVGNWDGAQKEMKSVMRRFGRNAGGHLFYNLLEPYVRRCLLGKRIPEAQAALKDADSFEAMSGSILDNDLKKLRAEVASLAE